MSFLYEHEQQRREVQELHRLAMDAYGEGQYATAERLLEQAALTAEHLDDLPLLVEERFWLGDARSMQSKYAQALSTHTWLIGLATDSTQSHLLRDADSLNYLARSFKGFVWCGHKLSLPVEQLLRVVSDGLNWLEHVGQPNLAAGLRLERGKLFEAQERWQEARHELEAALALRRRHLETQDYKLSVHLLSLADLLCKEQVGAYAEAITLAKEVLADFNSGANAHFWAYTVLAYAHLSLHEHEAARRAAQQSLTWARSIESPNPSAHSYEVLGKIHRAIGRLSEATVVAAQQWRWARKNKTVDTLNNALISCIEVRLLQARDACGLPLKAESLSEVLPAQTNRKLAQRRLASAHRLIRRARPFASQLDQSRGNPSAQDELDTLARQVDQLIELLAKQESH